jgi:large subunit ribosomal protein L32e
MSEDKKTAKPKKLASSGGSRASTNSATKVASSSGSKTSADSDAKVSSRQSGVKEDVKKVSKKAEAEDGKKKKKGKKEDVEIVEKDDNAYVPNPKPQLDSDTVNMLKIRKNKKARQPNFKRQEWWRYKRLGTAWRKPKGLHSKKRLNLKYRPANVSIGYGSPKMTRGFHPSGFEEVLVHTPKELDKLELNPKQNAIRIGGTVGKKKRLEILEKADELGIHVLNRRDD